MKKKNLDIISYMSILQPKRPFNYVPFNTKYNHNHIGKKNRTNFNNISK